MVLNYLLPIFLSPTFVLVVLFFILFYVYATWPYNTFKKLAIPGPPPLPLIGNLIDYKKGLSSIDLEWMKKYGKYWGVYEGQLPVLIVADTKLIKQINVKEFPNFANRRLMPGNGPVMKYSLTVLQDAEWKRVRSYMSPFNSAYSLKQLCYLIENTSDNLVAAMKRHHDAGQYVDVKEIFGCYTMDVISSTGFGTDVNSLNEPDSIFIKNVKKFYEIGALSPFTLLTFGFPWLAFFLDRRNWFFNIVPPAVFNFFADAIRKVISIRESNPAESDKRVDVMQLLLKSHNTSLDEPGNNGTIKHGLSYNEILANGFIFWIGGYDTTATTISFLAYNLALNPDIQERVIAEIDDVMRGRECMDYKAASEMKYLKMCVDETLRMYPPSQRFDRQAKEDIDLDGVKIPKGMCVQFSSFAIHYDPDNWPDPEKFDPERFTPEEKKKRDPYAYVAWGVGPRSCVMKRLGMLEVKFAIAKILLKYRLRPCEKTQIPIRVKVSNLTQPDHGMFLKLEARTDV
ncbi:CYP3A4 [Branchiostoma lanceolatum]|uniref:CYP3A4 protein n=2 Tax=Branchiostoma lanceolatum TaxID=7740 RepID=A0A8J9ZLS6_BRALA|nr:CYP3A4 [Branchiostoma lanceolatum]